MAAPDLNLNGKTMPKYTYEPEVVKAAADHGLDPDLVAAFCGQESSFNPTATRFEAKFQKNISVGIPTSKNCRLRSVPFWPPPWG
jgi:soluble lytic murein transglycosylase-like protein